MDLLDRLLDHDKATTADLLRRCAFLTDDQLDRQFDIDHGSARAIFRHMIGNVEVWSDLMSERAERTRHVPRSITVLVGHHETAYRDFATLARRVQAEGRINDTYLDTLDEPPRAKTYGGTIAHVVTHNMHHRAHVLLVLGWLGLKDLPEGDLLSWEAP